VIVVDRSYRYKGVIVFEDVAQALMPYIAASIPWESRGGGNKSRR